MAPRVLVDATAVPADRGALGRYVDGLVAALGATGADLAVACQRNDEERYGRLVPEASIVAGPTAIAHRPARLAWEQTGLPLVAQQVNADVLHAPHYTMPLRPGVPVVVTIHDLTYFTEPDAHNPVTATFFKSAIRTAARRATRLLVPSKATRDELVRVLGADPTRIDVAYHGVDHALFHRPTPERMRQVSDRLGLHGKPYVAYLGGLEPRKNVPALISGWAAAVADLADPPALVLGGGSGWSEEVDEAVAAVPAHLRLVRPGYLRFTDLPGFLGGALVVAFPSRGEGFRAAGAGGHGVWRPGAHHAPDVAAGGRRGRGRLHRARRRGHPGGAARPPRRPGPAGSPRRGRARPLAGIHLGGLGRSPHGLLPACSGAGRGVTSLPMSGQPEVHSGREPLEAILLVGGQGTRLRPLTIGTPKPLLPTAGVPFLAHQFAKAAAAGITHVVLATAYRASMFAECFGDGAAFGLQITYVHEAEPLGTGGAIRNAASGLRSGPDSPVVVLNGDILSGHDIPAQIDLHRKSDAAVTLHLVEVPDPARFGCVPTDPEGRVTAFLEKTPEPGHQPDQRGLLRFPPVGHRRDPARPGDLRGTEYLPRPDRRGGPGDGLPRFVLLAGRGHPRGVRAGLL